MKSTDRDLFSRQQFTDLTEQAERFQRNFLQIAAGSHYLEPSSRAGAWAPCINVVKTKRAWWVIAALPGAKPNQIDIHLEGNELIIAGTRPLPACCSEGELTIWEIPVGRFERRLSLHPGIRFTIAETCFENGLLTTELRKSA
jgi:HSP20 family molecular chaperone IbpA